MIKFSNVLKIFIKIYLNFILNFNKNFQQNFKFRNIKISFIIITK